MEKERGEGKGKESADDERSRGPMERPTSMKKYAGRFRGRGKLDVEPSGGERNRERKKKTKLNPCHRARGDASWVVHLPVRIARSVENDDSDLKVPWNSTIELQAQNYEPETLAERTRKSGTRHRELEFPSSGLPVPRVER